jgi:hypothetical protein
MRSIVKKTFEAAKLADIALIVQVKNNQPTLLETITRVTATTQPVSSCQSRERGRGRDERRTVTVFRPGHACNHTEWKDHVRAILRVERIVYTRSAKTGLLSNTTETAFYIASQPLAAERAATAIRGHWRIETTSHYIRDVTLGEDRSRIRCNPGVFARLRSFGFNILKANKVGTLNQDRYRAALGGFEALSNLVNI